MARIEKVGDLKVYRWLVDLHLRIHKLSMQFPQFELYELGSQIRRSSNSIPANLAEGFNNRHAKMYLQAISRSLGELRETQHHLLIALRKQYLPKEEYNELMDTYMQCAKMLRGIYKAMNRKQTDSNL